jgi:hypothetical protein
MYKIVVYHRFREGQEPNFCVFFNEKRRRIYLSPERMQNLFRGEQELPQGGKIM